MKKNICLVLTLVLCMSIFAVNAAYYTFEISGNSLIPFKTGDYVEVEATLQRFKTEFDKFEVTFTFNDYLDSSDIKDIRVGTGFDYTNDEWKLKTSSIQDNKLVVCVECDEPDAVGPVNIKFSIKAIKPVPEYYGALDYVMASASGYCENDMSGTAREICISAPCALPVAPSPMPSPKPAVDSPEKIVIGDVDLDGRVTSRDYLILKRYFNGINENNIGKLFAEVI